MSLLKFSKSIVTLVCLTCLLALPSVVSGDMFNGLAVNNATVQPGGPRAGTSGKNFLNIEGSANGNFASYGVVDFQFMAPTIAQTSISSLSISFVQQVAGFSAPGTVLFFLDTNPNPVDIEPGTSPLIFDGMDPGFGQDVTDGDLILSNALGGGPFSFTVGASGDVDMYTLVPDAATEAALLSRLNTGGLIRFVIGTGDANVAATWAGFSNVTVAGPTLTVVTPNVVPEPTSAVALGLAGLGMLTRRKRN